MYTHNTFCLSIHLLIDTWTVSTVGLLWIMLPGTFLYKVLFSALLGQVVTLCLTYWGTAKLFSTGAAPFYNPTNNVWGFQFFYIIVNTCYFLFLFFFCCCWLHCAIYGILVPLPGVEPEYFFFKISILNTFNINYLICLN